MIKQDTQAALERAAVQRQITEERKAKETKNSGGWRLLAVQSIACVVLVLLALFVRLGGGSVYDRLRGMFSEALLRNELTAALAEIWDGDPAAMVSSDPLDADGELSQSTTTTTATGVLHAGGRALPSGVSAVAVRVTHPAYPPLAQGTLTSGYGFRDNPTGEGEGFHRGVDIAAPHGTPIHAMYYATVATVGENASLGKYIILISGHTEIVYAHCSAIVALPGTTVRAGETVAQVGATGDATGNHLHIAVTVDGVVYNPTEMVPVSRYA